MSQKIYPEYSKIRAKLAYSNWDCKGREIKTLLTQDLFKKMGTSIASITKPVDLGNQTLMNDNVIIINKLELLGGKK